MTGPTLADELRSEVAGTVLAAGEPGYDEARTGHNPAARHTPDVVVLAASTDDLAAAVRLAARHRATVQVQNTGHGPSVRIQGGVLLRVDALTGITVDPATRTARVEPGVTWGQLVAACAEHGLAPQGMGSVATVGVIGYTLGGGLGPLARQQGYAADHVVGLEVLTARGPQTIDAGHEPDLFWALRGGRLGLGVVTATTLALTPEPTLYAARLVYPRPLVGAALPAYAGWREQLGESTASLASLFRFPDSELLPPPLRGQRMMQVDVLHLGAGAEHTRAAVDELADAQPPASREDFTGTPAQWLAAQQSPPPVPSWQSSFLLDGLDAAVATDLLDAAGPETEAPWGVIELRVMSGAAASPPATPNAVARWSGLLVNLVVAGDPAGFAALPHARDELKRRFGARAQTGTVINFHGIADDYADLRPAWPRETLDRLAAVRARHDPNGLFSPPVI